MTNLQRDIVTVGVLGVVAYFGFRYVAGKTLNVVPEVVKEGAEAGFTLFGNGIKMITNPLDAFGISPTTYDTGSRNWEHAGGFWNNPNDPVSNNDSGINFNLFGMDR